MTAREQFRQWTECLLDPTRIPQEHRQAANAWCAWALEFFGIDENRSWEKPDEFFNDTMLPTGKAISPLSAARCVREYRRTAIFLQGIDAAIQAARARFPGETIHLIEAGCGPLAPLALPFALRYRPDEVRFTLLDFHAASLDRARQIVTELGLGESVCAYRMADATTVRFAGDERPHVIACEVLLRALRTEPQVAATINLAPQVRPGGFFLPERIEIVAALFDEARRYSSATAKRPAAPGGYESGIEELGGVFTLAAARIGELRRRGDGRYAAGTVRVPPHRPGWLQLLTRIEVFEGRILGDFESSLNLPERLDYPAALAERGGQAEFCYEVSAQPGPRLAQAIVAEPSGAQSTLDGGGHGVRSKPRA